MLVDSEPLAIHCLQSYLERHEIKISYEKTASLLSGRTFAEAGELARSMGAKLEHDWLENAYRELYEQLNRSVKPISGIENVLDALDRSGIPYAVGSNGRLEKMRITLSRTGLLPRFKNHLYSAQDLGAPKPAPDVYLKIASDFCTPPSECLVIEDTAIGASAAFAAGIPCLGYVASSYRHLIAPYTISLFTAMDDLPDLIGLKRAG